MKAVADWHAFDPVALPGQRGAVFVPFESLTGEQVESKLREGAVTAARVSVVGPIGSGKSSAIEYALETTDHQLAVMWISAAHEGRETLIDAVEFARHVIRQIVRWAHDSGSLTSEEQRSALLSSSRLHSATSETRSTSIGLKLALGWLEPSWADEVKRTLADPEVDRLRSDFVDSLDRLVALLYERGFTPVVVVDDFDRWVNTTSGDTKPVLAAFFDNTVRMLAERNWSLVLAIQPEYASLSEYRRAVEQGFLASQVEIPLLPSSDVLKAIFDERVRRAVESENERRTAQGLDELEVVGAEGVFEDRFELQLYARYEQDANLRPVFTIADQALREAVRAGESTVLCAALADVAVAIRV